MCWSQQDIQQTICHVSAYLFLAIVLGKLQPFNREVHGCLQLATMILKALERQDQDLWCNRDLQGLRGSNFVLATIARPFLPSKELFRRLEFLHRKQSICFESTFHTGLANNC